MAKKKEFTPLLGDLSRLTEEQRSRYVQDACDFLGVPSNLGLVGLSLMDTGDGARQLVLYVKRGATDIIREAKKIDVDSLEPEHAPTCVVYKARGHNGEGRHEMAVGAVSIEGLRGVAVANAIKTAQTQALRRMTLQFAGGGFLDESEVHETTSNIANAAASLQQIAQPINIPNAIAGKDITQTTGLAVPIQESPKPEPPKNAAEAVTFAGGSPSEEKARKPRKKRIVTLDTTEQVATQAKIAVAEGMSHSEYLEAQLEPRPESVREQELTKAIIEAACSSVEPPFEIKPKEEEKPFVGTRPTKEQGEAFRKQLSTLVNDTLPKGGFRQSQGRSKNAKVGAFVQAMFPKGDPKNLSVEQQTYFLEWIEKKIQSVGVEELVKVINKQIGETE